MLYFDDDRTMGEMAVDFEWQEVELMTRAEIIEELCDILAQSSSQRNAQISPLLLELEWSNAPIDELGELLAREETTEYGRIEVCLEVLRKR